MRTHSIPLVAFLLLAGGTLSIGAKPSGKRQRPQAAESAPAKKGKQVYQTHCAICHFSASAKKKIGPGLKGLMTRGKFVHGEKVSDESLRQWIENGGKNMPSFRRTLNDEQLRELIAYLKTL